MTDEQKKLVDELRQEISNCCLASVDRNVTLS